MGPEFFEVKEGHLILNLNKILSLLTLGLYILGLE